MIELTIRITVELLGVYQKLFGKKVLSLQLDRPANVKEVISKLSKLRPHQLHPSVNNSLADTIILLNKVEIGVLKGLDTKIKNGDKIVIIPATHGG
ncbi:MAG: MoaD/ThiS family protein [Candidatus Bathyarchaeota archaeon]|nr:MAG: MoaD/ThiS family protein [Candidatus Bathyarchaeota archaeon]